MGPDTGLRARGSRCAFVWGPRRLTHADRSPVWRSAVAEGSGPRRGAIYNARGPAVPGRPRSVLARHGTSRARNRCSRQSRRRSSIRSRSADCSWHRSVSLCARAPQRLVPVWCAPNRSRCRERSSFRLANPGSSSTAVRCRRGGGGGTGHLEGCACVPRSEWCTCAEEPFLWPRCVSLCATYPAHGGRPSCVTCLLRLRSRGRRDSS